MAPPLAELLFWPAVLAYGEAAVAYAGGLRRPALGALATWGVRIGWLAQTALLAAQAVRADGFPWASSGGALNLFVWLVVGAYLIWGCRPRYRLLGLAVMPPAALLLLVAYAGGGTSGGESHASVLFLSLHVGLVLSGFAGLTLAAAMSALYVWQEQRLKRRAARVLRLNPPALATLDSLAGRAVATSVVLLALGIAIGLGALALGDARFDVTMAATLLAWCVYAASLILRYEAGWRGRRGAYLVLSGFALVVTILPLAHLA